jgi:hypothetical protein
VSSLAAGLLRSFTLFLPPQINPYATIPNRAFLPAQNHRRAGCKPCRRLRYTVSYPAFSTTVANAMKSSLLLTGLAQRLLLAAVLLAVIWGVYTWAVAA